MSDKKWDLSRRDILTGSAALAGSVLASPLLLNDAEAAKKKATPQVPQKVLGKTKQNIPILLFGAGFRMNQVFDPKLAEAVRYGVTYIDAADCYGGGTSENAVAQYHKRMKNRKNLWITSKSDEWDPDPFAKRLDRSLKRLQTNYVDLYYLHGLDDKSVLTTKLAKKVEQLKKQGKLRYFGFSCHSSNVVELMNIASKLSWVDSIMFRYNFRQYGNKALNKAIDACAKANIGLIAMKTQGSSASFEPQWKKFKKKGKFNKHQAVLKAVWADQRITAAVSHMDTFQKLRENIAAALDRTKLTSLEVQELKRYAAATRSMACDGCDHICNSVIPADVQIGNTMRYLMYHDVYGHTDEAKALFANLPAAARSFEHLDFSAATAACPNNIDLNYFLKRAGKVLV